MKPTLTVYSLQLVAYGAVCMCNKTLAGLGETAKMVITLSGNLVSSNQDKT